MERQTERNIKEADRLETSASIRSLTKGSGIARQIRLRTLVLNFTGPLELAKFSFQNQYK